MPCFFNTSVDAIELILVKVLPYIVNVLSAR